MTGFKSKKAMTSDKISELINEATATAWIDRVVNGPIPIYTEDHMVQLAELLVLECTEIISREASDRPYLVANIKKHFGINHE